MNISKTRYHYWIELKAYDSIEEREKSFILVNFKDEKDAKSILRTFDETWIEQLMSKYSNDKQQPTVIDDMFEK